MSEDVPHPDNRATVYPLLFYITGHALVFGGGNVGMRKAISLADHGVEVTVVDEREVGEHKGIRHLRCHVERESFRKLIDNEASIVVCALDDASLNEEIASYCMERSIMVNVATSRSKGTFAFPAVLDCGEELIAITSLATCPECSHALKRYIAMGLPGLDTFSRLMHRLSGEGLLCRDLLERILSSEDALGLIREGRLDEALDLIRGVMM